MVVTTFEGSHLLVEDVVVLNLLCGLDVGSVPRQELEAVLGLVTGGKTDLPTG
jgi:hypothetical protein